MSAELPAEYESLSHAGRVRAALELGRQSRTDPAAAEALRGWRSGGFVARLMAVHACHGSRDGGGLVELCADASKIIAAAALHALIRVGTDDQLVSALAALPRRRALAVLSGAANRRRAAADRVIAAWAGAGDADAWALLPLASDATLDAFFAQGCERGGADFWRRLAARRPGRAVAELVTRLNAVATPDGALFLAARLAVGKLADRAPELALELVDALSRHVGLWSMPLAVLVTRRPVAVAERVLALPSGASGGVSFARLVERLGVDLVLRLCRRDPALVGDPSAFLARLPAAERQALFDELAPAWRDGGGLVPAPVALRLPAETRAAEARKAAASPKLAAKPGTLLRHAALLPWAEATAVAAPWLAHPEGERRAEAIAALTLATRFERDRLPDLLDLLVKRKHEQDPVRQAFAAALAELPPGRWLPAHLPPLAQVVRDALDAGDLSVLTLSYLERFLYGLLGTHPAWASERLAEVAGERGLSSVPRRPFTAEEVRRMAGPLTPVIAAWSKRESVHRLMALARAVGRHLSEWPELVARLERVTRDAPDAGTAGTALALLCEHLPRERERLMLACLDADPGWVTVPTVSEFLSRRWQDRLTPYLAPRVYTGRFGSGRVSTVLNFAGGFHRWTAAQQLTYADALLLATAPPRAKKDAAAPTWEAMDAVRRLALLPAIEPAHVVKLASDKRPAVREAAVRALGRVDASMGVPTLLECLGDERARFAVYALRGILREMPPARVLDTLRAAPMNKVTVAKEAVRLAGEFGGSLALPWLVETDSPTLHRDVRGALLRALWDHLERPEAWAVIDRAAGSPDLSVVAGLARVPTDRLGESARARVAGLILRLLAHPNATVRLAALERLAGLPVPDPSREVLTACLARVGADVPEEAAAAVSASLAGATDADAPLFARAFADLLPRRAELLAAVGAFVEGTRYLGERLNAVRAAPLASLVADPACTALRLRLAASLYPTKEYAAWVATLATGDRWHAATQQAALDALAEGATAADWDAAAAAWAKSPDPALRWLALRATVRAAANQGWTAPRRRRLEKGRADAHPLVADAAAFVFVGES